ncbi:unnamed protein product [Boreogadus saida]
MGLLQLFLIVGLFCVASVLGFGIDPALRVSVFDELTLGDGFDGVTQVQGFHSESRAFHFQGSSREVRASVGVSERIVHKLRGKSEFTVLVTLKQELLNSGVILSIHHSEQSSRELVEGDQRAVRDTSGRCLLFECKDRTMRRELPAALCPDPGCSEGDQVKLNDRCCTVCRGHDFCAEGHGCVENSECVNLEAGTRCACRDGFSPMREDNAYCEDIDECAQGKHYCRENTMCVNTAGSFMCICHTGYIRIDDYSCTEHDECLSGMHNCDENALCFNMVGGHSCSCKPGYTGNGTVCKAMCDGLCQNGGTCVSPNNCICQQGFTGRRCETVRSGLVRDSPCPHMVCFLRLLTLHTLLLDYFILLYPDRRHSSRFETGGRRLSLFSHSG